jgi:uncharacterized delta-60 repeat protein
VWSLALQPDGKVVAAGKVDQNPPQEGIHSVFGLARYNPDGSLDQSFGSGGKVVTDFFPDSDAAYSVSIQHDGKIVAVGAVAVMRYNPDGSLDASFGSGGKVATPLAHGSQLNAAAAVLQPDGRIVLGGNVMGALTYNFALARFNTDGSIDSGFGSGGSVVTEFPGQVLALALEGDGRIVAAGTNTFNSLWPGIMPMAVSIRHSEAADWSIPTFQVPASISRIRLPFNQTAKSSQ